MKNIKSSDIYLTLSAVWLIVGLQNYSNYSVGSLGIIFVIAGAIMKFKKK